MRSDFCAFILTHGRPEKVVTYKTLKKCGYTGKIFLVVDNEDKTYEEYKKKYGDEVVQFSKLEVSKTFDTGDNFQDRRTIVYARNVCFELAKKLGFRYFIELDDDYPTFAYKFDTKGNYKQRDIKSLDKVWEAMVEFYEKIPALTIAMAQGGDFIGWKDGGFSKEIQLRRKAMNSFICDTERPFQFMGRINEDVNTYTNLGGRGGLFLTTNLVILTQIATQKNKGGMSDVYLASGTYLKSFYSVMYSPSCVKVAMMGDKHRRLHHNVAWGNTAPVIIREDVKTASAISRK